MNMDHIKFIEAIVEEGSFRKAAEKLFISQPAISASIKKLEQELNIDLFDKDSYRAALTDEGKAFYEKAVKVLAEFNGLEEYGQSLKKGIEPEIKIAIDAVFNFEKTLNLINKTMQNFPNTKITLVVDYMNKLADYLENKKFDLIICPVSFIEKLDMDLEKYFLEEAKLYHVIAPTCYLSKKAKITEADLLKLPQAVIRSGTDNSIGILKDSKKWYVNDFYLKKIIIMQGLAWGMIPEYYMARELNDKKLIPLKNYENFEINKLRVFAIRNNNVRHRIVAESIWAALKEAYP
jgi:DNA-binding transcriptional LysR family regulator